MLDKIKAFRKRLRSNEPAIGPILDFDGWQVLRGLRSAPPFHFVWIDLEHGALTPQGAYKAIDTMAPLAALPLVRATSTEPSVLKKIVDLGAAGLILPHVNDAARAREAIAECLYPPQGRRSIGPNLAANQWMMPNPQYLRASNEQMLIVAQIEHVSALEQIERICAIERIDVIFIGRFDLSGSMGRPGEVTHPEVVAAERKIVAAGRAAGKAVGTIAPQPALFKQTVEAGYNFIAMTSLINLMVSGFNAFLSEAGHGEGSGGRT